MSTKAYRVEESEIELALRNLVWAIDMVHWSPQYQAVWTYACINGLEYMGPSYAEELEGARKLLMGRLQ